MKLPDIPSRDSAFRWPEEPLRWRELARFLWELREFLLLLAVLYLLLAGAADEARQLQAP